MYTFKQLTSKAEMLQHLPVIQTLYPDIDAVTYSELLDGMLPNTYAQLAIFNKEECIGIAGYWLNTRLWCGKYLDMDNVVVLAEYRGRGIGTLMLKKLEEIAKQENCKKIVLDAYVDNYAAVRFYIREGFIQRGYHMIKAV